MVYLMNILQALTHNLGKNKAKTSWKHSRKLFQITFRTKMAAYNIQASQIVVKCKFDNDKWIQ